MNVLAMVLVLPMPFLQLLLLPLPLLSQYSSTGSTDLQGLKVVHLLFRHGDRTPINPYPKDPYKAASEWPVGFGQLTSLGKQEQLRLGQWVRARYSGFLGADYSEKEVYVRSTDVDRTLMSASAHLAGLFPPHGYLQFDPDLAWQPVPVHTVPKSLDALLSSHATCPRFDELQKELEESKFMKDLYTDNRDMFEYISANTGINVTTITELDYIYDSLFIESIYNKSLPDWTAKVFPESRGEMARQFKKLRDLSFTVDTFTHELKRLKGGPFVQELLDHFEAVRHPQPPMGSMDKREEAEYQGRKLFIYSAHDTTVAPILHTLGVFNGLAPPYASMVIVELLEREAGLHVRLSYKNTTDSVFVLTLPGCQELCPLDTFKALTASIVPSNWREECGLPSIADPVVQRR